MLVNVGSFIKKNGEKRDMRFLRVSEMPDSFRESIGFSKDKEAKKKVLAEGSEMVYDVDAKEFRVFNWNSTTTEVVQQEMDFEV